MSAQGVEDGRKTGLWWREGHIGDVIAVGTLYNWNNSIMYNFVNHSVLTNINFVKGNY